MTTAKNNYQTVRAVQELIASGEASSERAAARIIAKNTGQKLSTVLTRLNRGKRSLLISGESKGKKPATHRLGSDPAPPAQSDGQAFESAEDYLAAVVCGQTEADPARIRAAGILIRFQESIKRVPKPAPPPKALAEKERHAEESSIVEDFEKRAAVIRAKHAERLKNG